MRPITNRPASFKVLLSSRLLGSLALLSLSAACAGGPTATLSATASGSPTAEASATTYSTTLQPGGALGMNASKLRDRILEVSRGAAQPLIGDARLAELARALSGELSAGGKLPASEVVDFFSHHLGLPSPETHVFLVGVQPPDSLEEALSASLERYLARERYDRFGVYAFNHEGLELAIVALIPHFLELSSFPREVSEGRSVTLNAELRPGLHEPELIHLKPGARAETHALDLNSERLRHELRFDEEGIHELQLTAIRGQQRIPIATFRVAVGVEHPLTLKRARAESRAPRGASASEVESALFELMNGARLEAGLEPLNHDEALAELSRAHSLDMRESGFLGHSSPRYGDPKRRVEAAGIAASLILENIGRGESAEEIHRALLGSPGHRRNLLHAEAEQVGVGVVEDGEGGYLATQIFARRIKEVDASTAQDELLRGINRERKSRGLAELKVDANLSRAASEAATAYIADESLSHQDALRMARERTAQLSVTFTRIGSVMTIVSDLKEAEALDSLMVSGPTHIGLGLAQGQRPGMPRGGVVIIGVLGYPR